MLLLVFFFFGGGGGGWWGGGVRKTSVRAHKIRIQVSWDILLFRVPRIGILLSESS